MTQKIYKTGMLLCLVLNIAFLTSAQQSRHINEKVLTKIVNVQCPIDTVWWKWTTSDGLKSFFGPDNKIEIRPGGAYEIYFSADTTLQDRGGEGNTVLAYLPKSMITFTWNAPPDIPTIRNHKHKTWVVVEMVSADVNVTTVKLSHLGWLDGEDWDKTYVYFDQAWDVVLQWLQDSCQ